jgi:hypothetical protein
MKSHMEEPRKPRPPSKPKPDGKPKPFRPIRSRFIRLARLISKAWGWLCC